MSGYGNGGAGFNPFPVTGNELVRVIPTNLAVASNYDYFTTIAQIAGLAISAFGPPSNVASQPFIDATTILTSKIFVSSGSADHPLSQPAVGIMAENYTTGNSGTDFSSGAPIAATTTMAGVGIVPPILVVSGSYNSGTGLVTLTLSAPHGIVSGTPFSVLQFTGTGSVNRLNGSWFATAGTTGSTLTYVVPTNLTLTISTAVAYPPIAIIGGTYNSATGATSLTTRHAHGLSAGMQVGLAFMTGTGSIASLQGFYTSTAGTAGTTLNFTAATGLTLTVANGVVVTLLNARAGFLQVFDETGNSSLPMGGASNYTETLRLGSLVYSGANWTNTQALIAFANTPTAPLMYAHAIPIESQVGNMAADAPTMDTFNPFQFCANFNASIGDVTPGFTFYRVDAGYTLNPFNPIAARTGYFVPAGTVDDTAFGSMAASAHGFRAPNATYSILSGGNNIPIRMLAADDSAYLDVFVLTNTNGVQVGLEATGGVAAALRDASFTLVGMRELILGAPNSGGTGYRTLVAPN